VEVCAPVVNTTSKLPILLFSHGVGGNRLIYTHFLSRIASLGFVVMAVEHTDGLGSGARMAGQRYASNTQNASE
jgi:platelet-activating factor acetylhydrolase